MANNRWIKTISSIVVVVLMIILSIAVVQGQVPQPPSPEDAQAIEATIARSAELNAMASYTLDGSILAEVYINDPRGGELDKKDLELIQYIWQDKSLTVSDVGYLDYRQAIVAWKKQAFEKREAIFAKMQAEGREQMTREEEASLIDETGRIAIFNRPPAPATKPKSQFTILSMDAQGDVVTVIVDFGVFKAEQILVKVDGRWYIAGGRTLSVTG
jgi:hypothetical protein